MSNTTRLAHDRQITISVGKSCRDVNWKPLHLMVSELYARFEKPHRSTETMAEYLAMPKKQQDALKDVGGFVGGTLNSGRRKAANVLMRDVVTLDFDNIPAQGTNTVILAVRGLSCGAAIYSTRKHTPAKPRLRIVIPLDRSVSADEYEPIARFLAAQIGIQMADPTTFEASRLMFWPSCCADGEYIYETIDAPLASADAILGTYADWHDVTSWPVVPGAVPERKTGAKKSDPTERNDLIGAFTRAYDVFRAIDELIPGTYEHSEGFTDRMTYTGGSTQNGAVVYDAGKFLFSHHATDPCSGKLVNSFDLVRLHRFGDRDDGTKPDTPSHRLPSYQAMCEYAQTLTDVRAELHKEAVAEFADLVELPAENADWAKELERDAMGHPKKSLLNGRILLSHLPDFAGKICLNEFTQRIEVCGDLPWERTGKLWRDSDTAELKLFLERKIGKYADSDLLAILTVVAKDNGFHPVRDYLHSLTWDGVPRLDTLFIDYLGAADDASGYCRAAARKALVAAVARIMEPGIEFDCMPVLIGRQGAGKSTLCHILARDFFTDDLRDFDGKEAAERLVGAWIVEISELQALARSQIEVVKAFLSRQADRFRPAYGRMVNDYPRCNIFIGTTNKHDFQRDQTGGRRFWPIDCDQQPRRKDVWKDLPGERDQIWAEAVCRYTVGEPLFLAGEVERAALDVQEDHRETGTFEGLVEEFINKKIPIDWNQWPLDRRRDFWAGCANGDYTLVDRGSICAREFLCECVGFTEKQITNTESRAANDAISRAVPDWIHCGLYSKAYGKQRGFRRPTG